MTDIMTMWRACRVRRWHTNEELAGTDDRIDGHSGRVARIILLWKPDASLALIKAALTHDDGEWGIGDIAQPAKAKMRKDDPITMGCLDAIEEGFAIDVWGTWDDTLSKTEADWLYFADKLDAYIWAMKHGAKMDRNGWPSDLEKLKRQAVGLGVFDKLKAIMEESQ